MMQKLGWSLPLVALFAGCEPEGDFGEADVTGALGGASFTAQAAYHGDRYIVLVDQPYPCIDLAWVRAGYTDANTPDLTTDLRLVQIVYDEAPFAGTATLEGDGAAQAIYVRNLDGEFSDVTAREGLVGLDAADENQTVANQFTVTFADEADAISGTFTTTRCPNLGL